ncbi:MAG: Muramoyltetrapeptide carboxypeptidase (EC [uncultured Paraburkholderia sp.]|nr:MAG: Muramoyltetrapeptide carboxypeptidase (EC [uncultured Paraburkholderia sp.]CAH2942752.1 MAG: Muramoyltetrapeptide carboxypeptidase (EC [uncultured Paraburkholderia sp.]
MTVHRTVELIAPFDYPHNPEVLQRALRRLHVQGVESTKRRYQRFAGTDSERAADLNRLADPSRDLPDIVLAVRGGYGAVRILHSLDYEGLQRRLSDQPVALVGHSDFTAVRLALLARAGVKTFGGPMLMSDFGAENISEFTMQHFWSALTKPTMTVTSSVPQAQSADVSGMLWGGNLAVLSALIGTPYMPPVQGGILFLEDVNEQSFRIERMLYQLHLSGILSQQQAVIFGDFSGSKAFDYDNGYDLHTMIEQIRSVIRIPVITGLQFGHVPNMLTLPVGTDAHLVANTHGFKLTLSNYPYLG